MDEMTEIFGRYSAVVRASIAYARATERVRSCLQSLTVIETELPGLLELDAELKPEVAAAVAHLHELAGSLERASKFLGARFDAVLEANRLQPPAG